MLPLLLLLLPITTHGCLKVQTTEPPKCECPYLAMNSATTYDTVRDHPFYGNISSVPRIAPLISTDDCSTSLYCEGDYSLVIFDTDYATVFGAFSADGLCDPYTQKWHVEDGTGLFKPFDRLYGVCVEYKSCTNLTCPYKAFKKPYDINDNHPFYRNATMYQYTTPKITMNGCELAMTCQKNHELVILDTSDTVATDSVSASAQCNPTNQNWVMNGKTISELNSVCINFAKRQTTATPPKFCQCTFDLIDSALVPNYIGYSRDYQNNYANRVLKQPSSVTYDQNQCVTRINCGTGMPIAFYAYGLITEATPEFHCDHQGSNKWTVTSNGDGATFSADFLYFSCFDSSVTLPTLLPPGTPICNCLYKVINNFSDDVNDGVDDNMQNYLLGGDVSNDHCELVVFCREGRKVQSRIAGELVTSNIFYGTCSLETDMWKIESADFQVWENVPLFENMCVR